MRRFNAPRAEDMIEQLAQAFRSIHKSKIEQSLTIAGRLTSTSTTLAMSGS
jgi:hypothetical protein